MTQPGSMNTRLSRVRRPRLADVPHLAAWLVFAFAAPAPPRASAAGLLVPAGEQGSLTIASQRVEVQINDGFSVTTVTQVFRNHLDRPLEALYSFPIPPRASVSGFSLWVNGKEVVGEVLEKQRARDVYEEIVGPQRRRPTGKDPGLLEETSDRRFEMRVYPVPANGDQQVRIRYYQPVDYESGVVRYVYPLAMKESAAARVDGPLTITVDAHSHVPIRGAASPSHGDALAASAQTPNHYRAGIEQPAGRLDRDFVIHLELDRPRFGLNLITHHDGREDGFFQIVVTPGETFDRDPQPLNAVFVIDTSGSMSAESKLNTAARAAWAAIQSLDESDTFSVIGFDIAPVAMTDRPVAAGASGRALAEQFLKGLRARGGTEILPALERALAMSSTGRRNVIILLSDGDASTDESHARCAELASRNAASVTIATVGVGNDVNRPLLDRLARDSGGFAALLSAEDDVAELAPLLLRKLRLPLASAIDVRADGVELYDLAPNPLPNLYHGGQLVLFGRYRGASDATRLWLSADIDGKRETFSIDAAFPQLDFSAPEIARMWATSRIDDLMHAVRSAGESEDLRRQVVSLATTFGVTTRYTSYLVLESEQMYQDFGVERRNRERLASEHAAQESRRQNPQPGRMTEFSDRSGGGVGCGPAGPATLSLCALPMVSLRGRFQPPRRTR